MTPEEQRIAIAEACGYQRMPNAQGLMWNAKENRAVIIPGSEVEVARLRMKMRCEPGKETLPDYLHDLNAMHEAVNSLDVNNRLRWLGELFQMLGDSYAVANATSAQRAEAFLKTLGLWKD